MKLTTQNVKLVNLDDWNNLVINTYNKPYAFQSQNKRNKISFFQIDVPLHFDNEELLPESIPEGSSQYGVQFQSWLKRDPSQPIGDDKNQWHIDIWWEQHFYPSIHTLANDLFKKGLIEEGTYIIKMKEWQ
jgi:hypothetical protein